MNILPKIVVSLVANAAGLYAAALYIDNFQSPTDLEGLFIVAAVLTLINMLIKPILKFVLSPIIILTFGAALLLVNGLTLVLLDYLLLSVAITGLPALIYATILTTVINVAVRIIL